ncbi:MAG: hypothetical protein BWY52_03152 [Chloroflexi bacterium ADurb.Bin325]|nr:MAG: hypothetical protein BWY52_03152 [Chloroflexi bacterium ADurb.Bin325]
MNTSLDAIFVLALLGFLQLWGGLALGAGLWGRKLLPVLWGLLIGAAPLYLGVERGLALGSWAALAGQAAILLASAAWMLARPSRLRAALLKPGAHTLMIGTFLMAGGAVLGALFFRFGSEPLSLVAGGAGFIFGSMWFGAGIKQLRGK